MSKHIYLDAPNVGELEKKYLNKAIDDGFVSTVGPNVPQFEKKFAEYLRINEAVSVQSGTAALHMALYELKIGEGDEVIVPSLTFIATVNPVIYVGATPVFVDVDKKTWNINPKSIEKNITSKTKAIIPVHLYGNPCQMDEIMHLANKYNLHIIEDATESLGAKYKGQSTGTFGDFGCFSFNGNKIMTTGGGGMIVSKKTTELKHIRFLVNQAKDEKNTAYHSEIGFNYRMTNIEAALGLAQMEQLDEFISKKRCFYEIYREELRQIDFIDIQKEYENSVSSWWLTCIIFKKEIEVAHLQNVLKSKGIPTRRIFMPVVAFPSYEKFKKEDYKNSYDIYKKGLCLPGSSLNSKEDIYYVCKIIKENLNSKSNTILKEN